MVCGLSVNIKAIINIKIPKGEKINRKMEDKSIFGGESRGRKIEFVKGNRI